MVLNLKMPPNNFRLFHVPFFKFNFFFFFHHLNSDVQEGGQSCFRWFVLSLCLPACLSSFRYFLFCPYLLHNACTYSLVFNSSQLWFLKMEKSKINISQTDIIIIGFCCLYVPIYFEDILWRKTIV